MQQKLIVDLCVHLTTDKPQSKQKFYEANKNANKSTISKFFCSLRSICGNLNC